MGLFDLTSDVVENTNELKKEKPSGLPIDAIKIVTSIIDCYKEVTVSREEQLTLRTQARERSRVCIAYFEANREIIAQALRQNHDEKMQLLGIISSLCARNDLDEDVQKCVKMILDTIKQTDPMVNMRLISPSLL